MGKDAVADDFGGQEQFLQVLDRDEAERRFRAVLDLAPRGIEHIALDEALGRVLAVDVSSPVDVPSFDRSNVDGYAVVADDTFDASEEVPRVVRLAGEVVHTGIVPSTVVQSGSAVAIATGGMMPRGADAVVMVEHADARGNELTIARAVTAGSNVSFAGTDITAGETVLRRGQILTSRDTGVLAAIGIARIDVWRKPIVAILSTGDEIIAPGTPMQPALVYDSNAQVLADAVRELGGEPRRLGIAADDAEALRAKLHEALAIADVVLLSGGTSKGAGDVSYRVVAELTDPGIVAHGVALKPGKPICLAATGGRAGRRAAGVSDICDLHVPRVRRPGAIGDGRPLARRARLCQRAAGGPRQQRDRPHRVPARRSGADRIGRPTARPHSNRSPRIPWARAPAASPPSAAPTASPRSRGTTKSSRRARSSPCSCSVASCSWPISSSSAATASASTICSASCSSRACDRSSSPSAAWRALTPPRAASATSPAMHLLDAASGDYNRPFLTPGLDLIPGYGRLQGIVFRPGEPAVRGPHAPMRPWPPRRTIPRASWSNRNQGSGTRALIDRLLDGARPRGYAVQPRTHNAVAAAVVQGRADWGVTLDTIARSSGLGFIAVQHEQYDFVTPDARAGRAGVRAFVALLERTATREALRGLGMRL